MIYPIPTYFEYLGQDQGYQLVGTTSEPEVAPKYDKIFELEVKKFEAQWCGPCKAIAPIVEEIANDYDGKVKVGKMDVDNNNQVAMKYGIRSIPTLLLFKNGEVVDQVIGNVGKDSIESMLSKAL